MARAATDRASAAANAHNTQLLHQCRTIATVVGGATAGILGLRGLYGAAFYAVVMVATAGAVLARAGGGAGAYWDRPTGVVGGGALLDRSLLLSYLLFWTLFYSAVHMY